jgi:diguanylate cyclase (GGDEF)-like protein
MVRPAFPSTAEFQQAMENPLQDMDKTTTAPLPGGPPAIPGPSGVFGTRLRQLGLLNVDELQAESFWRDVTHHRRAMVNRLGRDVGQRVALLDYIVNLQPQLLEPQEIEHLGAQAAMPIVDRLTGLHNRYFFDLELARETERCRRYDVSASLVLIDVDDFKVINERHGPATGDEVLQAIAAVLLHYVRAPDVPCRYDGDTFALILPLTPQVEAMAVAQRICSGISSWFATNLVGLKQLSLSASGGVASLPMEDCSMAALVREAESALRDAKVMGGHRVVAPVPVSRMPRREIAQ